LLPIPFRPSGCLPRIPLFLFQGFLAPGVDAGHPAGSCGPCVAIGGLGQITLGAPGGPAPPTASGAGGGGGKDHGGVHGGPGVDIVALRHGHVHLLHVLHVGGAEGLEAGDKEHE